MVSPVLVALDFSDMGQARAMALRLLDHVTGFKVGLELLMSQGTKAVTEIAGLGLPVFADAKLHDIPSTVRASAAVLARAGARWVTAHASGGAGMMEAAVEGMTSVPGQETGILAVTVLTSLDEDDLATMGVGHDTSEQVRRLAELAASLGAEGVICSPHEARIVKESRPDLLTVTPGIRTEGTERDDQKRAMSPRGALEAGADLLVIGRSITAATDPVAAASAIARALSDNPI